MICRRHETFKPTLSHFAQADISNCFPAAVARDESQNQSSIQKINSISVCLNTKYKKESENKLAENLRRGRWGRYKEYVDGIIWQKETHNQKNESRIMLD